MSPRDAERRPPGQEAATDHTHTNNVSVPHTGAIQDDDVPTLAQMNERGRRIAEAYIEAGYRMGWGAGYRAAEDEFAELHRRAHDVVQTIASRPAFAQLAEARGEPQRAGEHLADLVRRGVNVA